MESTSFLMDLPRELRRFIVHNMDILRDWKVMKLMNREFYIYIINCPAYIQYCSMSGIASPLDYFAISSFPKEHRLRISYLLYRSAEYNCVDLFAILKNTMHAQDIFGAYILAKYAGKTQASAYILTLLKDEHQNEISQSKMDTIESGIMYLSRGNRSVIEIMTMAFE